jgi:hypothetical protein
MSPGCGIYDDQQLVWTTDLAEPAELGRQSAAEESLYSHRQV